MKHLIIAVSALGLLYGMGAASAEEPTAATTEVPQGAESAETKTEASQSAESAETKTEASQGVESAETKTEAAQSAESAETKTEASASVEPVEIKTDEEKVNYSLGFELGKDLKRQELKLLPEALLRGAEDGVSGAKALVRPTQRAKALKQIKEARVQANLDQAQAFLAANAEKEGVQTLPSGLQYRELQPGEGKTPGIDSSVVVNYRGSFIDGTEFDSSYEREKPATFKVKKVIKGWREALQLMQEGAKWELFIPPELGYGKRVRPKVIPPNSALLYEVELISVK